MGRGLSIGGPGPAEVDGEAMSKKSGKKLDSKKLKKKAAKLGGKLLEKARAKGRELRAVVALCNRCGKAKKAAGRAKKTAKESATSTMAR